MNKFLLLLAVCLRFAAPAARTADPSPAAAVPILMQLDWKANAQFAGLLLAREKGYYAQAGLDVRIQPAAEGGPGVLQTVLSTPNAIGSMESSELLEARGQVEKPAAASDLVDMTLLREIYP